MVVNRSSSHRAIHPRSTNQLSLYILGQAIALVRGIQAYHRMCWYAHSPSCSTCRDRNHRGRCGRYNQWGYSLAWDRYTKKTMSILVFNQHVSFLPIYDIEIMKTFQSAQEFSSVKSWSVLIESTFQLQMMEKLAAIDESQHQVELIRTLKGKLERHNEGVSDLCQHCLFSHCMGNFWSGDDTGFTQDLHGVDTVCVFLAHNIDLGSMASVLDSTRPFVVLLFLPCQNCHGRSLAKDQTRQRWWVCSPSVQPCLMTTLHTQQAVHSAYLLRSVA